MNRTFEVNKRDIRGNISEDRVWEKYYDYDLSKCELPKMTQKDYLFQCIGNEPDRVIIDYRGKKKFTVKEFSEYVSIFEKAFSAFPTSVGDVVCTIALSTPEMIAIKYAATSLGLITCHLNVLDVDINDNGKNRLIRQLDNVKPKFIFIADILLDKVKESIFLPEYDNALIVIMPIDYSCDLDLEKLVLASKGLHNFMKLNKNEKENCISLKAFLSRGKSVTDDMVHEVYKENMPCNISFTSGTTGINKAVLISHDANNALGYQQRIGKLGMGYKDRLLLIIPPFLAFWDADVVHAALCIEGELVIELSLDYDKIPSYFIKHKNINVGVWSQYLWSSLIYNSSDELRKACEHITCAIVGGERCDVKESEAFYKATGVRQTAGYGTSEVNTTFSFTHPNIYKEGSAGIPLPLNNVMILDDNYERATYNERGRLYITGPCMMEGYYHRPDLTLKSLLTDSNGTIWYDTGDYAYVDEDGCLYVIDRYMSPVEIIVKDEKGGMRVTSSSESAGSALPQKARNLQYDEPGSVLHDDFGNVSLGTPGNPLRENVGNNLNDKDADYVREKVNLLDLNEVIGQFSSIKNSKMTYYDGLTVLHVSFRNQGAESLDSTAGGADLLINEMPEIGLIRHIKKALPYKYWPDFINIKDELPRTAVGKVNYKMLSEQGEYICKNNVADGKLKICY